MGCTWREAMASAILSPSGVRSEEINRSERSTWAHFQEPSVTGPGLSWQIKTQG